MQFGLQLNSQHPATENMRERLRELLEQARLAEAVGFHSIVAPQHYLPAPFQMLQPLPLLARVAAEAPQMRLIAGIILLSLQNPVALAEEIGTLDIICHGQFTLGVAIGYREPEFQAFGMTKADAVPRLIEVLSVMKRLWTEEKVTHQGRFFTISGATLTTRPLQHPHPPIWMGADGDAAVRRVARLADTWYINPHAKLETLERQLALYREALAEHGKPFPREVPIRRELFVAKDRDTALRTCMPYLERGSIGPTSPGVSRRRSPRKTRSTSHSTSYAISGSSSAARMIVSSNCASIISASGRIIFCCGFNGRGCPKNRCWKRSHWSVSASFHACARFSRRTYTRSSHDRYLARVACRRGEREVGGIPAQGR
jgi:alkanesulfonate monooxygenase SsuD/methylene tetrahydromethanopterin reductase-like flavin-dependent oxidoreductase (luciferase family)